MTILDRFAPHPCEVWERRRIYDALASSFNITMSGEVIPRALSGLFRYATLSFEVMASDATEKFHRIYCLCTCGKRIPFGRMMQHAASRFHKANGQALPTETPETRGEADAARARWEADAPRREQMERENERRYAEHRDATVCD